MSNIATTGSTQTIENRVSQSLVALLVRQVIAYGTIFFGNILLSRWLLPETYGIFAAVLAFQQMLVVFGDLGLGPALVQRVEKPTDDEIASLFTMQLLLVSVVVIIIWLLAPWIAIWAKLGDTGVILVRTLALILVVVAFRSIPAMLLERDLHFRVIALAETTGIVIYQIILTGLVWYGVGVSSIIWALVARYLSDLLIILWNYPWQPRLSLRVRSILPYIWFGLNMQGVRITSYAKDQLPLLLLVPLLGVASAGQWGWALSYIGLPLYFLRLIDRTMFPAYSRAQHDRKQLSMLISKALWLNLMIGLPILIILIMFGPILIKTIYGEVWLTTLPVVNVLALNMLGGLITGTIFPVLYGVGKSGSAFKLFLVWLILTCIGSVMGIYIAQLLGIAIAFASATILIAIALLFMVRNIADIQFRQVFTAPVIASIGAVIFVRFAVSIDMYWLLSIVLTASTYLVLICLLDGREIYQFVRQTVQIS